jgi:glycosyltransferase involved in cell wall biosynthesis
MKDTTPAVSVVIPTFRRPKRLERAIESVLHQTFGDFECIVIDGGSKDETAHVVSRITEKDPRVRYVEIEDLGISASRNAGVRESRAEFVAFLDDDDEFLPRYLEKVIEAFRELPEDVGAVGTNLFGKDPAGFFSAVSRSSPFPSHLWGIGNLYTFRKKVFIEDEIWYDEKMRGQEEWDFGIRFGAKYRIHVIEEPLAVYHITFPSFKSKKTSLTADSKAEYRWLREIIYRHKKAFESAGPEALAALRYRSGIIFGEAGEIREARQAFAESLSVKFSLRTLAYLVASYLGRYSFYTLDYMRIHGMRFLRVWFFNRAEKTPSAEAN